MPSPSPYTFEGLSEILTRRGLTVSPASYEDEDEIRLWANEAPLEPHITRAMVTWTKATEQLHLLGI